MEIDECLSTAMHELGHAWLVFKTGETVESIRMWKTWGCQYGGATKHSSYLREEQMFDLGMVCLAGQEAESLWQHRTYGLSLSEARSRTAAGSSSDLRQFNNIAYVMGFSKQECRNKTTKILLERWPALEVLGVRFAERMRLSPSEVKRSAGGSVWGLCG